jgi:hypothetical protein
MGRGGDVVVVCSLDNEIISDNTVVNTGKVVVVTVDTYSTEQ